MWETIRAYLTFTRKERFGVLFLLLIICILFIIPYFFKPVAGSQDPAAFEKYKDGIRNFESVESDTLREPDTHHRYTISHQGADQNKTFIERKQFHGTMFCFDLNTISSGEWQR